jgi:hypothetical protein
LVDHDGSRAREDEDEGAEKFCKKSFHKGI